MFYKRKVKDDNKINLKSEITISSYFCQNGPKLTYSTWAVDIIIIYILGKEKEREAMFDW